MARSVECLAKVSECDVLVVIVAHRYGWKPPGQRGKSVTWLECLEAERQGKEVIAFLVDEKCEWPENFRDRHRIAEAVDKGTASAELLKEVQDDIAALQKFKAWLNERAIRRSFRNPDELHSEIRGALNDWKGRQTPGTTLAPVVTTGHSDPTEYLRQMREQCAWIDIRGLQVGAGKAHRFPIEDLYIPLKILSAAKTARLPETMQSAKGADSRRQTEKELAQTLGGKPGTATVLREFLQSRAPLEEALANARLVAVGDPGAGKTTFLRHLAMARCRESALGKAGALFPILLRVSELAEHIRVCRQQGNPASPALPEAAEWLIHFLNSQNQELNWGLRHDFFRAKLKNGRCLVLLDGLDEAPTTAEREAMVRLFENATAAYGQCRFVVTTRPLSYQGRAVLADFQTVQIEPLETEAIQKFLEHWCAALFPESQDAAKRHLGELSEALRRVPEIRRMARNPVMLTALAVVHWNERRLPEQRADLYESIVNWLARSREKRKGREPAERCLALLQRLALAVQSNPQGRQVQVEKGQAAEVLAGQFDGLDEALKFVEQEEVDSGIIVSRGPAVRFWHLTFQEFLAARAIAGLAEKDQMDLLLRDKRVYQGEWREVLLLLVGVLLVKQGPAKVDGLFAALLDDLGRGATLAEKARCAGLLGAMVNDLRPLQYKPADGRYRELLDSVLGIFDEEKAKKVEFTDRLAAAEALGQAGDPRLMENNWVAFGTFEMGKYPVTVAEYTVFVEDDGYADDRWWKEGWFKQVSEPRDWAEQLEHPNRPIVNVSWYEAAAYGAWKGARLPTEAEWEMAAAGKSKREYPWGDEKPDAQRANYGEGGPGHATPVGLYPAGGTPEGLQDMAGNVWEWCEDWYEKDKYRVLRGGAWVSYEDGLRSASRSRDGPEGRDGSFGFRLARDRFS